MRSVRGVVSPAGCSRFSTRLPAQNLHFLKKKRNPSQTRLQALMAQQAICQYIYAMTKCSTWNTSRVVCARPALWKTVP